MLLKQKYHHTDGMLLDLQSVVHRNGIAVQVTNLKPQAAPEVVMMISSDAQAYGSKTVTMTTYHFSDETFKAI